MIAQRRFCGVCGRMLAGAAAASFSRIVYCREHERLVRSAEALPRDELELLQTQAEEAAALLEAARSAREREA